MKAALADATRNDDTIARKENIVVVMIQDDIMDLFYYHLLTPDQESVLRRAYLAITGDFYVNLRGHPLMMAYVDLFEKDDLDDDDERLLRACHRRVLRRQRTNTTRKRRR